MIALGSLMSAGQPPGIPGMFGSPPQFIKSGIATRAAVPSTGPLTLRQRFPTIFNLLSEVLKVLSGI